MFINGEQKLSHAENKRERLEQMERLLLAGWHTPTEISRRLDCNRSTIHRYFDDLSLRGVQVLSENGRYHLNPADYVTNVRLTSGEALTIYLALRRFIRQTSKAPDFFIEAIRKISTILRHPTLTEQLVQSSLILEDERGAARDHAEVWRALQEGWLNNTVVRVEYEKEQAQTISEHEFEPYLFEPAVLSHGVYVIGWSRTRNELRTFKIDRIRRARSTSEFFTKPDDLRVDDLLRHAWAVWYGQELTTIKLHFSAEKAWRVRETIWHPNQRIETLSDGSLYWSVDIAGTKELISWVRGWGEDVIVLEPLSFRAEIAESLRRAADLYRP